VTFCKAVTVAKKSQITASTTNPFRLRDPVQVTRETENEFIAECFGRRKVVSATGP